MKPQRSLLKALAVVSVLGTAAPATATVDLLSHRAAYRLSLHDSRGTSGLTEVQGGLVMEWRASCEGWISNQRLGFVADQADGSDFVYDVRFSSWESTDNRKLRFNVRSFNDGALFEEFRGQAALEADGAGVARYIEPDGSVVDLPAGTMFPTRHMSRLVQAALNGEIVVSHEVFDGSGPEALSTVSAVIGKSQTIVDEPSGKEEQRWPVSLAYYGSGDGSDMDLPEFQISFELTASGVLHNIVLDYGDFALDADLEEIETFAEPHCD